MRFFRLLAWCVLTAALVIGAAGGAGHWFYRDVQLPGPLSDTRRLIVPAHSGIAGIAEQLAAEGVIRRPFEFQLAVRLTGRGGALKPGEYDFPPGISTMQTIDILASGKTVKHRLTIPEGLTSAEIVSLVQGAPALDGDPGP